MWEKTCAGRPRSYTLLNDMRTTWKVAGALAVAFAGIGVGWLCLGPPRTPLTPDLPTTPMPSPPPSFVAAIEIYGQAPVVARGHLTDGRHFYFRARGEEWTFTLGATADDALDDPQWVWHERYGDRMYAASYMSEQAARVIVESCAAMAMAGAPPPEHLGGVDPEEAAAALLARMIVEDLVLYEGAKLDAGDDVRAQLAAPIAEARESFRKRTAKEQHHLFEQTLEGLEARLRGEAYAVRWLTDKASARSVGLRWAAALARTPASERDETREEAERWLTIATSDGPVRTAWRDAITDAN